jgi:hypothetical protein
MPGILRFHTTPRGAIHFGQIPTWDITGAAIQTWLVSRAL